LIGCRKQKELLKALETPEEKRARRLAKIEAKKRKEKEKMGWDQEYMVSYEFHLLLLGFAMLLIIMACDYHSASYMSLQFNPAPLHRPDKGICDSLFF